MSTDVDEAATRAEHAGDLGENRLQIVEVRVRPQGDDRLERGIRERQLGCIGAHEALRRVPGPGLRHPQLVCGHVDADNRPSQPGERR